MRQLRLLVLLTLIPLASCGGSSTGASPRPAGASGAVYDAVMKFETSPDCDGITDVELKKLASIGETRDQQCKIARQRSYPPASSVKVRAIKVNGTRATAEVPAESGNLKVTSGGKTLVERLVLVELGGRWRISDVNL